MSDLVDLLERVRSATGPDRELDEALRVQLGYPPKPWNYTASIDAALALTERVLPGWVWLKKSPKVISLYRPLTDEEDAAKAWAKHYDGTGATAPIAILAATLSALIDGAKE